MGFRGNRVVVVQNYESIAGDAGPIAAVVAALAAAPSCLVDSPTALAAARINATAFSVTWAPPLGVGSAGGASGAVEGQTLLASTLALTLPSGALAAPDVASALLPAGAGSFTLALPQGFDGAEMFVQVGSRGCAQASAAFADAILVSTSSGAGKGAGAAPERAS
jgi:hypothetical protein